MFTICSKEQCTGCGACVNVCEQRTISMVFDAEGFWYPSISVERCSGCGACVRVCPTLHAFETPRKGIPEIYACWNKNGDVRLQSASGGVFSAFAQNVLDKGGVVFGAAFDEVMQVRHILVDSEDGLAGLRSSKYVQSDVGRTYSEVIGLLQQGRRVLFSGTPCQVAALRSLVPNDDKNLLTCDVLCHGVSSPRLFAEYVAYLEARFKSRLVMLNFRHKRHGWKLASTVAVFKNGQIRALRLLDDSFMYGFSNNLTLRPACYKCRFANTNRIGDITLGDFWGLGEVVPFEGNTRNGVSLVMVNSEKGRHLFQDAADHLVAQERSLEEAMRKCVALNRPWPKPEARARLFADFGRLEFKDLARRHLVDRGLKGIIKRVVPRSWIMYIREHMRSNERQERMVIAKSRKAK